MAWTEEQLAAMQKGGGNLLVAAGAGSGKTAVLIERVLGIITDQAAPVDVDDLLILTFTNAAAAEMRQRLAQALAARLAAEPENAYLNRQLVLLPRARIMTIHAFCRDLLRENGYMLGLDAKSRIGGESELALLREKTLDDVFEAAYADPASGLKELLRHYCRGIGDDNLRALVLRLIEFGQSMPDVTAWLDSLGEVYATGRADAWTGYFADYLAEELAENAARLEAAGQLALRAGLVKHAVLLEQEAGALRALAGQAEQGLEAAALLRGLLALEFKTAPAVRAKDGVDVAAKDRVLALRKDVKDNVAALLREGRPLLLGTLPAELAALRPLALALLRLAEQYFAAWQQAKRRARLWEFADLEHYALELLQNEEFGVAADLRQRFYEILVDEYQDINEVQERLLSLLSNGQNRFMVGDIKQSIYRFRLAEPGLFLAKFAAYGRGEGGRRIDLNKNFRSQSGVLAGVNFVFSQLLSGGRLEITYDAAAQLYCGRPELPAAPCELLLLDREAVRGGAAGEDETSPLAELQNAELEAAVLAERILAEHAAGRPWGDMVVLLRAVKSWAPAIGRVFAARGIPCRADGQEDFLRLPEIQVVLSLLSVLDNPRQDIPLAAVLHSPLVGLSLADLADLRQLADIPGGECLFDGLARTHDARLLQFSLRLDVWRQQSRELGVADLLEYLYNETALSELMGELPGGEARRRNLAELLRLAAEYDENGGLGLSRFLPYLAAGQRQTQTAEQPDAVRLMSIHKSKGLEFPVVFVAGLAGRFNEDDFRQDILLHRTLGLGMRRVEPDRRRKYPTFGFNVIMRKARWENLAEALRILYVAMTRAEEKLILVGTLRSREALAKQLAGLAGGRVSPGFLQENQAYLPWLAAALLRHKDGGVLRELAGVGFDPAAAAIPGADGDWQINIIDRIDVPAGAAEQGAFSYADWLAAGDAADAAVIDALLERQYPAAALAGLPVKWSATAFERLEPLPEEEQLPAAGAGAAKIAAEFAGAGLSEEQLALYADIGLLTHKLLEKADLTALAAGADAAAHLRELWRRYAPEHAPAAAQQVDPETLAGFFRSGLGERLLAAARAGRTVLREQKFIANLPLGELAELDTAIYQRLLQLAGLAEGAYPEEGLFVQGVIDLAFAEADGLVLVDYKSGRGDRSEDEVRRQYGLQLALYRRALQTALRLPVKEGYIYFSARDRAVQIF